MARQAKQKPRSRIRSGTRSAILNEKGCSMTDDVNQFFKDANFVSLISLLEEATASAENLKGLDSEQKQQLSQAIKDAIWQKMPHLGKIKDNPGNVECYYWIGKLFSW